MEADRREGKVRDGIGTGQEQTRWDGRGEGRGGRGRKRTGAATIT